MAGIASFSRDDFAHCLNSAMRLIRRILNKKLRGAALGFF
ncbi:hypothetical protein CHCC20375_1751 [Bacillus licheniformis]|nr:hypothetical protein CHCC20375_1751 [Bacillus licheniformis]